MTPGITGSLDTNVLLRLVVNDVPEQHEASKALFRRTTGRLLVSDAALIEMVFALGRYYLLSRTQIREAVIGLMAQPKIHASGALFKDALALFVKHPKLSFEDCYLAVSAQATDALPLWTFDEKLAKQTSQAKLVPVDNKKRDR